MGTAVELDTGDSPEGVGLDDVGKVLGEAPGFVLGISVDDVGMMIDGDAVGIALGLLVDGDGFALGTTEGASVGFGAGTTEGAVDGNWFEVGMSKLGSAEGAKMNGVSLAQVNRLGDKIDGLIE